eukprot:5491030-Pleurochrysis_carterae.AAC.3
MVAGGGKPWGGLCVRNSAIRVQANSAIRVQGKSKRAREGDDESRGTERESADVPKCRRHVSW